ncbi:hypothetical protein ACFOY8_12530 [Thalassospira xianhensis]|nr:hypothetical protein [Thalassospira xianhensis]
MGLHNSNESLDRDTFETGMKRLEDGELHLNDAFTLITRVFDNDPTDKKDRLYDAIRNVSWQMLSRGEEQADLSGWAKLCMRTATLCATGGDGRCAGRFEAISDLLQHSSNSVTARPSENDLLAKKHVREIIEMCLQSEDFSVSRQEVRKELGIRDSNATRVINIMIDSHVLVREQMGKEAVLRLSERGKAFAAKNGIGSVATPPVNVPRMASLRIPVSKLKGMLLIPVGHTPDIFLEQLSQLQKRVRNYVVHDGHWSNFQEVTTARNLRYAQSNEGVHDVQAQYHAATLQALNVGDNPHGFGVRYYGKRVQAKAVEAEPLLYVRQGRLKRPFGRSKVPSKA